jgi:hypothetical protein
MGGVNDRRSRPTEPYDSQRLAKLSEKDLGKAPAVELDEDDQIKEEWGVEPVVEFELVTAPTSHPHVVAQPPPPPGRVATGTTPPKGVPRTPTGTTPSGGVRTATTVPPELRSRTATVHDPLTTSVLAEVARRTVEQLQMDDDKADDAAPSDAPDPNTKPR